MPRRQLLAPNSLRVANDVGARRRKNASSYVLDNTAQTRYKLAVLEVRTTSGSRALSHEIFTGIPPHLRSIALAKLVAHHG